MVFYLFQFLNTEIFLIYLRPISTLFFHPPSPFFLSFFSPFFLPRRVHLIYVGLVDTQFPPQGCIF